MQMLAAHTDLSGYIKLIAQPWWLQAVTGKSLVVGDAETEGESNAWQKVKSGIVLSCLGKPNHDESTSQ
jgi:hypothetical protein